MVRTNRQVRRVRHTVLIVGEGEAELNFLRHIRALYTSNNAGHKLTVNNAKGKGAENVVDKVIRQSAQPDYDTKAALLDNDTPCIDRARARAKKEGIVLLEQSPCFEAWLLSMHGINGQQTTKNHKSLFLKQFGVNAHEEGFLQLHFNKEFLDKARLRDDLLDRLLNLLGAESELRGQFT